MFPLITLSNSTACGRQTLSAAQICLVLAALALSSAGCASHRYQAPLTASAHVNPTKGYIYGRFALEKEMLLATRLALELNNVNTGEHLSIGFKTGEAVFPIEVMPGTYQVTGLILAKAGPNLEFVGDYQRKALTFSNELSQLNAPFQVRSGEAVYVGDYYGSLGRTWNAMPFAVGFNGSLSKVLLEYEATTGLFKSRYPQFEAMKTMPLGITIAQQKFTH